MHGATRTKLDTGPLATRRARRELVPVEPAVEIEVGHREEIKSSARASELLAAELPARATPPQTLDTRGVIRNGSTGPFGEPLKWAAREGGTHRCVRGQREPR